MRRALVSALVLAGIAGCWSTKKNPIYCGATSDCTGTDACNPVSHQCEPATQPPDMTVVVPPMDLSLACTPEMGCADPHAPFCAADGQSCRACDDMDCTGETSHCATTGTQQGACVQCLTEPDCAATHNICNAATNTCAACKRNTDCGTGICDGGTCATTGQILYVNNAAGCVTTNGTQTTPYCEVSQALAAVTAAKPYILVTGSATAYAAISVGGATSITVTIVGPGTSPTVMHKATFTTSSAPALSVAPSGSAADVVTIDGLELIGGNAPASPGAKCQIVGGTASVTIRDSLIDASGDVGVNSSSCALVLSRNTISGNSGGGISITNGTYVIENNFVVQNLSLSGSGVTLGVGAMGTFRFNTVAANSRTGNVGGISCDSISQTVADSIVFNNTTFSANQCTATCTLANVATGGSDGASGGFAAPPMFVGGSNFRLVDGDAGNIACCIDKASSANMPPDFDVDNNPRPKRNGYDVGAQELQ